MFLRYLQPLLRLLPHIRSLSLLNYVYSPLDITHQNTTYSQPCTYAHIPRYVPTHVFHNAAVVFPPAPCVSHSSVQQRISMDAPSIVFVSVCSRQRCPQTGLLNDFTELLPVSCASTSFVRHTAAPQHNGHGI